MKVLVQAWTESERGWGQRPDGLSLHRDEADLAEYVERHDKWQADINREAGMTTMAVPDCYTFAEGAPYYADITDDQMKEAVFAAILSHYGYRVFGNNPQWLEYHP